MSTRRAQLLALALALIGVPAIARAQEFRQERLFALVPVTPNYYVNLRKIVEIDTRPSTLGRVLREWPANVEPPDPIGGGFRVVGAGRYLVWVSGYLPGFEPRLRPVRLNVFDTQTGTVRAFDGVVDGAIIAVDDNVGRIFVAEPLDIAVVDARTGAISRFSRSLLPDWPDYYLPTPAAYAAEVDRLFLRRTFEESLVDVFDVASGTILRTLSVGSGLIYGLATDPRGTRLFTIENNFTSFPYVRSVSAYDTATSQLVARTSLAREDSDSEPFFSRVRFDPDRRRLLVGSLVVFDADTLARLGSIRTTLGITLVGPRSPLLFFTSNCISAPLESWNASSGQPLGTADLASLYAPREWCVFPMAMATVPRSPRAVTSDVQSQRVSVSWTDPGNTTHFQVEAGSAPGLADLYQQSVGGTSLTIESVPAGTYYMQVRAVNYVGRSAPVEIAVVVP